MADNVIARKPTYDDTDSADPKYEKHPTGAFLGVCCDVIDLGDAVEQYENYPKKLVPKLALVFWTGERNSVGDPITVKLELTNSLGEKAKLRHLLESWLNKPLTEDQVENGVPLGKLVGFPAMVNVAHKQNKAKTRTYAYITSVGPVPDQLKAGVPKADGYKRAAYWNEQIKEYAEAAAKFRAELAAKRPIPAPVAAASAVADPLTTDALADSLPF